MFALATEPAAPLEDLAQKSRLRSLRIFLVLLLMASAGALGASAFLLFRRVEERVYELQFEAAADQVAQALGHGLADKAATATAVSAFLGSTGSRLGTFPNVTFPGFEAFATAQLAVAQARALSWNPLLPAAALRPWSAYATSHLADLNATPALLATVNATAASTGVYERNAAGAAVSSNTSRPFTTPVWQIAPLAGNAAAVFYDLHSQVDRRIALDMALASSAPAATAIIQLVQDVRANVSRASGIVFAPVHDAAGAASAPPVGFVSCVFSWDSFLASALPAFITSIDVVLSSPGNGAVFTFRIAAGGVAASLPGDVHERGLESIAIHTDLNTSGLGQYFTLAIYPTAALRRSYLTNNPRDACIGVVCIIAAVAAVFRLYDAAASNYSGQLAAAARAASRIVDGVFPATVRKRLFRAASAPTTLSAPPSRQNSARLAPGAQPQRNSMDSIAGVAALRRLIARLGERAARDSAASAASSIDGAMPVPRLRRTSSTASMLPGGAPIADHFDNCTVLFADLVAFTRWSADVTPERVFALLEAVFGEFDAAARRLRVFKVETIGDCYLAVTGLPEPDERHASSMAAFALQLPSLLRRALASQGLGGDALRLRVGLHSGSVTAGVLRGDRSRFQLFGDTVNTASRMESTGEAGRIQVSGATADALRAAGAPHALRYRGKTEAKGKGQLDTYWLEKGAGQDSDDDASAPASPRSAPPSPPEPPRRDSAAEERV